MLHPECETPFFEGSEDSDDFSNDGSVTFLGVEPFGSCVHCGKADGVVHHVRDNRHLDRPSVNLHEECVVGWFAGPREDDDDDAI